MGSARDLTGSKIGLLTLLNRKRENNRTFYYCKCDCGNEKWIRADYLKNTKSCGCLQKETQFKMNNIKGKKFGRLLVLEGTDKRSKWNGSVIWKCKCNCGNITYASAGDLVDGAVRSCGCLQKEGVSERGKESASNLINYNKKYNLIEGTNIQIITREEPSKNNTSGIIGVFWDKDSQKWRATISFKNKTHYLGRYENKEDAIKARKQAEEKLHKNFLKEKGIID